VFLFFMLVGGLLLSAAVTHELKWLSLKRSHTFAAGKVVALVDDSELDTHLEIEYELRGETRRFVSDYGGSTFKKIGDDVTVLVDLKNGRAEHYSLVNRWLFTFVPAFFSGWAILIALSSLAQ